MAAATAALVTLLEPAFTLTDVLFGIGPRVLADLGVTLDRARAEVQRRVLDADPAVVRTRVLDQLGRAA